MMEDPNKSPHPDARARLLAHFSAKNTEDHPTGWDELWGQNFVPWDKGFPSPALVDLLTDRTDLLGPSHIGEIGSEKTRKKALVPGCGKGYDVLLLAAFGYDAYGLEFSPKALEQAKQHQEASKDQEVYKTRDESEGKGNVTWLSGDFFKDDWVAQVEGHEEGKFDLIYDYTFLSALHPSMRPAWAARFKQLLSPNGRIVCLEFPTYKPPKTGGPPWALPPKVYQGHLSRPGLELPYDADNDLLENKLGPAAKDGLVCLEHFQPARTHDIGTQDGKVTDWISVWCHKA